MNTTPIVIERQYHTTSSIKSEFLASTEKNNKRSMKEALQYGISILKDARKKAHTQYSVLFK